MHSYALALSKAVAWFLALSRLKQLVVAMFVLPSFFFSPLLVPLAWLCFGPITPAPSPPRGKSTSNQRGAPTRRATHADGLVDSAYVWVRNVCKPATTVPHLLELAVQEHGHRPCLGWRPKVREELRPVTVTNADGSKSSKQFRHPHCLGYQFLSYAEVYQRVLRLGSGLASLGMTRGKRLSIFASTRYDLLFSFHFTRNV